MSLALATQHILTHLFCIPLTRTVRPTFCTCTVYLHVLQSLYLHLKSVLPLTNAQKGSDGVTMFVPMILQSTCKALLARI